MSAGYPPLLKFSESSLLYTETLYPLSVGPLKVVPPQVFLQVNYIFSSELTNKKGKEVSLESFPSVCILKCVTYGDEFPVIILSMFSDTCYP